MMLKKTVVTLTILLTCLFLAGCGPTKFGQVLTTTTLGSGNTTAGVSTPLSCPSGSISVSAGNVPSINANTNYCFGSGTWNNFSVAPQAGDGFYGGGHATLSGGGTITNAFVTTSSVTGLIIDGFTMTSYYTSATDHAPGVIELQRGANIDISNNTFTSDKPSAISFGDNLGTTCCVDYTHGISNSSITHNTISNIGYSATAIAGTTGVTISYNDISSTDQDNVNTEGDIAALGKISISDGTIVNGNYVHNNNDTAIWFDNYDNNSIIENNTVVGNRVGIFYEICWNALITGNTLISNGQLDSGDSGTNAPGAAIRISSSGASTTSINGFTPGSDGPHSITVSNNTMTNNHEGVTLFDGHSGSSDYNNNVNVTGNTTIGDNTSTATSGDAFFANSVPSDSNISWSNNTYKAGSTSQSISQYFALNNNNTNFAGWKADGYDTAGTCQNAIGGSC